MTRADDHAFPVNFNTPGTLVKGLSKREYFSLHILQGLLSDLMTSAPQPLTEIAVQLADRLIAELNKEEKAT